MKILNWFICLLAIPFWWSFLDKWAARNPGVSVWKFEAYILLWSLVFGGAFFLVYCGYELLAKGNK